MSEASSERQRAATTSPRLPLTVRLLGWASLLNDIASEMVFPLLPEFVRKVLGASELWLGGMEGLADASSAVLKLFSGAWADRLGQRRGFVVTGYALAALSRPLASLVTTPLELVATRIADRVGKGIRAAPRDAYLADASTAETRGWAFGFQRGMDHLGAALGPLLAAGFLWFFPGQLRLLFLGSLVPGLAVVALVAWGLPAAPPTPSPEPRPRTFSLGLSDLGPWFPRYLLAITLFALGNSSDAFLLVRASQLGIPEVGLPLLWLGFHLLKSAGNLGAGRWVHRWGAQRMMFWGWLIYAAVYFGFSAAQQSWHVVALFGLYAFFFSLTEPAEKSLLVELVPPAHRGRAFGWFHAALGLSSLPASLLLGALLERYGAAVAFSSGAILALAAMAVLATIRPQSPPTAAD